MCENHTPVEGCASSQSVLRGVTLLSHPVLHSPSHWSDLLLSLQVFVYSAFGAKSSNTL